MRATPDALMHGHWPGGGGAELLLVYVVAVLLAMWLGLTLRSASLGRYVGAVLHGRIRHCTGRRVVGAAAEGRPGNDRRVPAARPGRLRGARVRRRLLVNRPQQRPAAHVRGAQVEATPERPLSTRAQAHLADRGQLSFAGHPLAALDETKHFKLIGTTGTGKSTAIRELLQGALRRGDRAVIADADGGYLAQFYDPKRGDVILNPFDPRSRRWDLFGEIH